MANRSMTKKPKAAKVVKSFPPIGPGEWVQPKKTGYGMACCDCGLVHRLTFRLVKWGRGHKIQFKAYRDGVATKMMRKRKQDITLA